MTNLEQQSQLCEFKSAVAKSYLQINVPHHSIPSLGSYIIPSSLMFPKFILWAIDVSFMVSTKRVLILSTLANFESLKLPLPITRSIFFNQVDGRDM